MNVPCAAWERTASRRRELSEGQEPSDKRQSPKTAAWLRRGEKFFVEIGPLKNYYPAEEYHQNYLEKNPNGYCHIPRAEMELFSRLRIDPGDYRKPAAETIRAFSAAFSPSKTEGGSFRSAAAHFGGTGTIRADG